MKKSYAIKVLNRIQLIRHLHDNFRKWGVDMMEYDDPTISLLEEAIPNLYATNEKEYEEILGWVQWWLYEDVEKIITINGNAEDFTNVSDFIDYIEKYYNLK